MIPTTLKSSGALRFWSAVVSTGLATGVAAAALTRLLQLIQGFFWGGNGRDLLDAVQFTAAWRRVLVLVAGGLITGLGQFALKRLSGGNGIDTTAAIVLFAGRLPALRTLGSAVLSVVVVGMGASLGREGAPKQAGAVFAKFFSDRLGLSDEQRRLLVASGAGAGMGAAYGVPLGGALFSLEVMRGMLALRFVLPALVTSIVATAVSWMFLPDAPTYVVPAYASSASVVVWALFAGPLAGLLAVGYIRSITWADRNKPQHWLPRFICPIIALGLLGLASITFPQLLGNGKDISQLAFHGQVAPVLLLILFALKPLMTVLCIKSGIPGGLFTPSLTFGALAGGWMGNVWSVFWPGTPPGLFALLGAAAVLAATTQGPISTIVLLIEFTGRDRSFILPMLIAVCTATLVARTMELRSVYDARLTDEQVQQRRAPTQV